MVVVVVFGWNTDMPCPPAWFRLSYAKLWPAVNVIAVFTVIYRGVLTRPNWEIDDGNETLSM